MSDRLDIEIRDFCDDDLPLVKSSYRRSWAASHPWVPRNIHNIEVHNRFARWARNPEVQIKMAVAPEAGYLIHGWICFEERTLHYIYVKSVYRGLHVAKRLLELAQPRTASHWTPDAARFLSGLTYKKM